MARKPQLFFSTQIVLFTRRIPTKLLAVSDCVQIFHVLDSYIYILLCFLQGMAKLSPRALNQ